MTQEHNGTHVNEPPFSEQLKCVLDAKTKDLGGLVVGRVLPSIELKRVGPFTFFDHMGPAVMAPGHGMDVRPHPHINLATVTYLFDGVIQHKDSLGSDIAIRPGAINWMTAGTGIVHSERTPPEARANGMQFHGIQLWIALPKAHEEVAPEFTHYPADSIPTFSFPGVTGSVLAGRAYGKASPVRTLSPLFYVDALLEPGATLALPRGYEERAAYVVEGQVQCDGHTFGERKLLVFKDDSVGSVGGFDADSGGPQLTALAPTRLMLLGGAPLDGPRFIWWNFVSSSLARIEQAKADWKAGRFPTVPGDDVEFIPLPEG